MKIKSFRDIVNESPVGQKGRTGHEDAINHITNNPELEKQFLKMVKELGGKTVVAKILAGYNSISESDDEEYDDEITSIEDYEDIYEDVIEDISEMRSFAKELGLSNEQVNPLVEAIQAIDKVDDLIRSMFSEMDSEEDEPTTDSKEEDNRW